MQECTHVLARPWIFRQHKKVLEKVLPEYLKITIAQRIENHLFSKVKYFRKHFNCMCLFSSILESNRISLAFIENSFVTNVAWWSRSNVAQIIRTLFACDRSRCMMYSKWSVWNQLPCSTANTSAVMYTTVIQITFLSKLRDIGEIRTLISAEVLRIHYLNSWL